ncbi:hypothetical protein [Rickettsia endosymbiont of Pantilius tunicatus]|uniref:hypothetical protein n=1 Tax=unclassified Rickettsia TaxID=114295 RepID=UPI0030E3498E
MEQLNILLNISASQANFPILNQYSKTLAMKVFSISDKNIFNISLQSNDANFANAIIYLTDKFDQRGKADYNQGLTLCINNQEITSQDILPIDESLLLGLPNIST